MNIKTILQRIIIGSGIALAIMFIKGSLITNVMALSVNSTGGWGDTNTFTAGTNQTEYSVIHNDTRKYFVNASGYFIFNFAYVYSRTSAVSGQNVDNLSPTVSVINVKGAGGLWFPCYYGSTSNFTEFSGSSQVNGDVYSYSVVCPIRTDANGIGGMQVGFIGGLPHYQVTYKFGERASFIFDTNSAQVQQQTEELNEVNNNLNDLNDSLNDDTIDSSTADDIFDLDIDENSDLTSVVTAPLHFIQSLNGYCSPLGFTLFNKTISLPCGSIFWGRSDVSSFRTIWNVLIGGAIIYKLALKLFHVVKDALNPDKDNVESLEV